MNWRTANKRKRRALARQRVRQQYPVYPFHVLLKPPFFALNWREWLDKVLPDLIQQNWIHENCLASRLLRTPEPTPTWRTQLIPRRQFDAMKMKAESRRGWASGMLKPPSRFFMIVDDLDFPCEPKPIKEFIYGDNWVAYKRIRPAV